MKIDRYNYEEYFLLYIDNELSVDQKRQVEIFVKENPDLEEELVMLQQSRLVPDPCVVFDKKHLLMKDEIETFINMNNYEEWLVLYTDDELNEDNKVAVKKFAEANPHVQQELVLFQQAKLQPEKMVFAHKEVLHRKEKVTVLTMQWWRVAVAASAIIAAGIMLYAILGGANNGEISDGELVKTDIRTGEVPNSQKPAAPGKEENTVADTEEIQQQVAATMPVENLHRERKQSDKEMQSGQKNNPALASDETDNNRSERRLRVITEINEIQPIQPRITSAIAIGDKTHTGNFNNGIVTPEGPQTPESIYVVNTETEKKKFRGFFRKATRIIERTTNINPADDDNKVLIGGMAINLN